MITVSTHVLKLNLGQLGYVSGFHCINCSKLLTKHSSESGWRSNTSTRRLYLDDTYVAWTIWSTFARSTVCAITFTSRCGWCDGECCWDKQWYCITIGAWCICWCRLNLPLLNTKNASWWTQGDTLSVTPAKVVLRLIGYEIKQMVCIPLFSD